MKNYRTWGKPPYKIAVIHGGPGAPGYMAGVARELAKDMGVLEPLQTKNSINGQIEELSDVLKKNTDIPVVLIGHSSGAWLAYFVAVRYPELVKKLIMVGAVAFEKKYADNVFPDRMNRLNEAERVEVSDLIEKLNTIDITNRDDIITKLAELFAKADNYDAKPFKAMGMGLNYKINRNVSTEAEKIRDSGELLKMAKKIRCPVVAVHGDYDTHLSDGVKVPLTGVIKDFKFILLEKCGHYPWMEKFARDEFFKVLKEEIV